MTKIEELRVHSGLCVIIDPVSTGYIYVLKKAYQEGNVSGGTVIYRSKSIYPCYDEAEQSGIVKAEKVLECCSMDYSILDIWESAHDILRDD